MRVAALLLALTLMTSCFVGGTFAKYTTAGTATDSARVAKWGVEVVAKTESENNMFKTTYATATPWTGETDGGISVKADAAVVAPGTEGTMTGFTVTGTPEVDVAVTYTNVNLTLTGWAVDDDDFYCPIEIWVDANGDGSWDADEKFKGLDYASANLFETDVEEAIVSAKKNYDAGTNLNTVDNDVKIYWVWHFEGSTEGGQGHADQTDAKDTLLGDLAVAPTISLTVTCTIEQID